MTETFSARRCQSTCGKALVPCERRTRDPAGFFFCHWDSVPADVCLCGPPPLILPDFRLETGAPKGPRSSRVCGGTGLGLPPPSPAETPCTLCFGSGLSALGTWRTRDGRAHDTGRSGTFPPCFLHPQVFPPSLARFSLD